MQKSLESLLSEVVKFRDERDWKQFHHPKDLAISISLEASEILENFQWKSEQEVQAMLQEPEIVTELGNELADVLIYVLLLSDRLKVDLHEAVERKLEINQKKYPAHKSFGKSTKYNKL